MSDHLRPMRPGDPSALGRVLNADTFNAFIEAAKMAARSQGGDAGASPFSLAVPSPASTVLVVAHDSLPSGSVIGIAGPANSWDPAGRKADAAGRPKGRSMAPATGKPFLVLVEPARAEGAIVRAAVSGAVLVKLSTPGGVVRPYAEPIAGDADKLRTSTIGPARVLWSEDDPEDAEERWATVLLGDGVMEGFARCGSATATGGLYPANMVDDSGPAWTLAEAVKLRPLFDEPLASARRYLVRRAKYDSFGVPVYHAVVTCCDTAPDGPTCACPTSSVFCVAFSGVTGGGVYALLNAAFNLYYSYSNPDGCFWGGVDAYPSTRVTIQLELTGYVRIYVYLDGVLTLTYLLNGTGTGPYACDGPNDFELTNVLGVPFEAGVTSNPHNYPETITVYTGLGSCASSGGPSSSPPPICNDAGDLCVTIPTFNADASSRSWTVSPSSSGVWMGGDVDYDVTVDMTTTYGGDRLVEVSILESGTGFGLIYAANYTTMDCAGGFTVPNNANSATPPSGIIAATVTVIEGSCP